MKNALTFLKNKRNLIMVLGLAILILAVPVTLSLVKRQQTLKSRADVGLYAGPQKLEMLNSARDAVVTTAFTSTVNLRLSYGDVPTPEPLLAGCTRVYCVAGVVVVLDAGGQAHLVPAGISVAAAAGPAVATAATAQTDGNGFYTLNITDQSISTYANYSVQAIAPGFNLIAISSKRTDAFNIPVSDALQRQIYGASSPDSNGLYVIRPPFFLSNLQAFVPRAVVNLIYAPAPTPTPTPTVPASP